MANCSELATIRISTRYEELPTDSQLAPSMALQAVRCAALSDVLHEGLSPLDAGSNLDYDSSVSLETLAIARSPIHFFSAGDPKEAGDANDLLHDWVVLPDFRVPAPVTAPGCRPNAPA